MEVNLGWHVATECDVCGKFVTDDSGELGLYHTPCEKDIVNRIKERIEALKKQEDTYEFYPVSDITVVIEELRSLVEKKE